MRKIVDLAKEKGIDVIFVQKGFDLRSARAVATEIGARIIETDPLEKDWLANLRNNKTASLRDCLSQNPS